MDKYDCASDTSEEYRIEELKVDEFLVINMKDVHARNEKRDPKITLLVAFISSYTNSINTSIAASPLRGPIFTILV